MEYLIMICWCCSHAVYCHRAVKHVEQNVGCIPTNIMIIFDIEYWKYLSGLNKKAFSVMMKDSNEQGFLLCRFSLHDYLIGVEEGL